MSKKPSRLYLDTEFSGWGGALLSIALVTDDASNFYEVIKRPIGMTYDPWVSANVVPHSNKLPIDYREMQYRLHRFLQRYHGATVIADWPCDFKYFAQALVVGPGACIRWEGTMELLHGLECKPKIPHNALSDALALRSAYLDDLARKEKCDA